MLQHIRRVGYAPLLFFFLFIIGSFSSCVAPKNYVYLNDLKKDSLHPGPIVLDSLAKFQDPKIEVNDLLNVSISVFNPMADESMLSSGSAKSENNKDNTHLVDKDGYIELKVVGFVKVVGLTTQEARDLIKQKAREYYKDPVVSVSIVNFEVTVLGDVGKAGVVMVSDEKATILDVLSLCGDLRPTAKRKNILLARSENNKMTFVRLDLTSTKLYQSPYFYVKQRDFIYVEPNFSARQNSDNSIARYTGYLTGLTSVFSLLVITNVIKVNRTQDQ
jgi:polysaccharide export outer membrane protein